MKQIIIPPSFKYPVLNEKHRTYGGNFLLNPVINPSGDWRKSLPPHEAQKRHGVEPSSCFTEAQQHTNATIEEHQFGEKDNNYSARFNALLANGTEYGGDPIAGADSIRDDGLVKEESMPHNTDIKTWEEFHSWKGVNKEKVIAEGQADRKKKDRRFGVIVERHFPLDAKYANLANGLTKSPIPMSVWGATDGNGNYLPKPKGVSDTHMVEATYLDKEKKVIHILDTYPPFEKQLPANYNFDFAMGWTVKKIVPTTPVTTSWLIEAIRKILRLTPPKKTIPVSTPPIKPPHTKLYEAALECLGTDASPKDVAPDDLSCAESVNNIHFKAFGEYIETPGVSTLKLFGAMVDQVNKFARVTLPEPGNIIISPTGLQKPDSPIKHGHVGIFGKDNKIMSSNSLTGKFEENYTLDSWVDRYRKKGGFPIFIIKRI